MCAALSCYGKRTVTDGRMVGGAADDDLARHGPCNKSSVTICKLFGGAKRIFVEFRARRTLAPLGKEDCAGGWNISAGSKVQNMAVIDIRLCPRCCPLASHFECTPCWRRLCVADYWQTWRHPQNRKYIALSSEEDRATVNMCREFSEVWTRQLM